MRSWYRNRKLLAGGGLVTALLVVALWPRAAAVDLAVAGRGALMVSVDEEGETRVRDRFVISSPVTGRLLRIELEPGDVVERGRTVVARLHPAPPTPLDSRSRAEARAGVDAAEAVVERSRAERQRARAAVDRARSELRRAEELAAAQIVSADLLEAREVEAREADLGLRAATFAEKTAEHELAMSRARLLQAQGAAPGEVIVIRAPVNGVVLRRLRESEATVAPGEPLLELGDPRELEIVSDLLSADAVKVRPGQRVVVERWGGDRPLAARVRRVEPSGFMKVSALGVEEQRVNVVMDFEDALEARAALGDGFRVEVRVVVWEASDVLKVPTSSLFRKGQAWAIFAVEGGRARLKEIELGERNGLEAEVRSGLEPGLEVVVHPSDAVTDGRRVVPRT